MIVSLKSKGYRWLTISPRALFVKIVKIVLPTAWQRQSAVEEKKNTPLLHFKIEKKPCSFADDLQPHTWLFLSGIEVCVVTQKTSEYLRIVILSRLHLTAPSRRSDTVAKRLALQPNSERKWMDRWRWHKRGVYMFSTDLFYIPFSPSTLTLSKARSLQPFQLICITPWSTIYADYQTKLSAYRTKTRWYNL